MEPFTSFLVRSDAGRYFRPLARHAECQLPGSGPAKRYDCHGREAVWVQKAGGRMARLGATRGKSAISQFPEVVLNGLR